MTRVRSRKTLKVAAVVLMGFGVMVAAASAPVRHFVLISISSWFASMSWCAQPIALFNIGFFLLFVLPVLKVETPQTRL